MLIVLAIAQVVSLLGAIPGILSVQVNAQFDVAQQEVFGRIIPLLILASLAILFGLGWWLTSKARKRLDAWKEGVLKLILRRNSVPGGRLQAWRGAMESCPSRVFPGRYIACHPNHYSFS